MRLQKNKITALKLLGKALEQKMAAIKNSDKRAKSIKNKNFRNLALRLRETGRTNKNKKERQKQKQYRIEETETKINCNKLSE